MYNTVSPNLDINLIPLMSFDFKNKRGTLRKTHLFIYSLEFVHDNLKRIEVKLLLTEVVRIPVRLFNLNRD